MVTISRLPGPFGGFVDGVDLERGPDRAAVEAMIDALYEHKVLVVRGQKDLSLGGYCRFGDQWGDPISFYRPEQRHPVHPQLIILTNSPDIAERARDGAMHWHSDSTYEDVPASVTMLYAMEVPYTGNDTLFVDSANAYDSLPESIKETIEDLIVIHHARAQHVIVDGERRGPGRDGDIPTVEHPLVIRHPVTNAKTLFGIGGTPCGIVGMNQQEAVNLLIEIKRLVTKPESQLAVRAEPGSILMWDNYSVVHRATRANYSDVDGERRLLYRISTRGRPSFHAQASGTTSGLLSVG